MAKKFAMIFGVVFVLVGLLGFISNPIVGASGYFRTDMLHNLVHIIVGVAMLVMAGNAAALALNVFGGIYILLALVGFIEGGNMLLGFIAYNSADNWLHLVLGIVLVAIGMSAGKSAMAPSQPSQPSQPQM